MQLDRVIRSRSLLLVMGLLLGLFLGFFLRDSIAGPTGLQGWSKAWFGSEISLKRTGNVTVTIHADTDTPTADLKLLQVQTGTTPSTRFSVDEDGDVIAAGNLDINGTGTHDVAGTLNLSGNALTSNGALTVTPAAGNDLNVALSGTGDFLVNTNDLVVDTSSGRVGISSVTPSETLDVGGRITTGGAVTISNSGNVAIEPDILMNANGLIAAQSGLYINIDSDNNATADKVLFGKDAGTSAATTLMVIQENGNVGIGSASPTQLLDVAGSMHIAGAVVAPEGTLRDDGGGWVRTYGNTGWYNQTHGGGWYMIDTTWIRSYNSKSIYHNSGILRTDGTFQVGASGGTLSVANGGDLIFDTDTLVAKNGGNVGIGSASPGVELDVAGDSQVDGLLVSRVLYRERWTGGTNVLGAELGTWTFSDVLGGGVAAPSYGNYMHWNGAAGSPHYLTSPGIDLQDFARIDGSLGDTETKTHTRVFMTCWVNTDSMDAQTEYMAIEVYDGSTWYEVYRDESNEDTGTDAGWKRAVCDLTPYINSSGNTQVRFAAYATGGADYFGVGRVYIYEADVPWILTAPTPSQSSHVANKAYVDAAAGGAYQFFESTGNNGGTTGSWVTVLNETTGPGALYGVSGQNSSTSSVGDIRVTIDGVALSAGTTPTATNVGNGTAANALGLDNYTFISTNTATQDGTCIALTVNFGASAAGTVQFKHVRLVSGNDFVLINTTGNTSASAGSTTYSVSFPNVQTGDYFGYVRISGANTYNYSAASGTGTGFYRAANHTSGTLTYTAYGTAISLQSTVTSPVTFTSANNWTTNQGVGGLYFPYLNTLKVEVKSDSASSMAADILYGK